MKPNFKPNSKVTIVVATSEDLKDQIVYVNKSTLSYDPCNTKRFRIMRDGVILDRAERVYDELSDYYFDTYTKHFIDSEDLMVIKPENVKVGDFIDSPYGLFLVLSEDCTEMLNVNEVSFCTSNAIDLLSEAFAESEVSRF